MGARENGSLDPKRVSVAGEFVASLVADVARVRGYRVQVGVSENADLTFVELSDPASLARLPRSGKVVALVPDRLRRTERAAFRAAGAFAVLDREAHMLDLLDAMSTGLFATRARERRYSVDAGLPMIRFATADGHADSGQLLQATYSGAVVLGRSGAKPGLAVQLELKLSDRSAFLRGRTVCSAIGPGQKGFGVEFALDADEVAPRLSTLVAAGFETLPDAPPARANAS